MSSINPRYSITSKQYTAVPGCFDTVDLAFIGNEVDDRGSATIKVLKECAKTVRSIQFDATNQNTFLDGDQVRQDGLISLIKGHSRVLIDTTTLGLGEILKILLAIRSAEVSNVEFLYAEPKRYTRSIKKAGDSRQMRDYSLTENCSFCAVHGFAHEYNQTMMATHVFLLGFEPGRVQNAIEQRGEINDNYRCHAVIGVPAFQLGWEANSIRPHLQLFDNLNVREQSISYCSAFSIREAYLTLWNLYKQLGDERGCFYVSPLGTKPHAVGAALFLLETKGADQPTSLYYDHPVRVLKRSSEVATWHHVCVQISD